MNRKIAEVWQVENGFLLETRIEDRVFLAESVYHLSLHVQDQIKKQLLNEEKKEKENVHTKHI